VILIAIVYWLVNNWRMGNTKHDFKDNGLDKVFGALADPTRRFFIERLKRSEATVSELAAPLDMSLPAASKHLKVLETAGLISKTKTGRVYRCALKPQTLVTAEEWIHDKRTFWNEQLDSLAEFIEQEARD